MVWDDFVQYCVDSNWYGAENLSLILGEVGAAAVQNIGAYGAEVCDLIDSVETMDVMGRKRIYKAAECAYAYRDSIFKCPNMKSVFILYVNFRLSKHPCFRLDYGNVRQALSQYDEVTLAHVRQAIVDIRRSKLPDPAQLGNAGSFFKNPVIFRTTVLIVIIPAVARRLRKFPRSPLSYWFIVISPCIVAYGTLIPV